MYYITDGNFGQNLVTLCKYNQWISCPNENQIKYFKTEKAAQKYIDNNLLLYTEHGGKYTTCRIVKQQAF